MLLSNKLLSWFNFSGGSEKTESTKQEVEITRKYAPSTKIQFKEKLIPALVAEHKVLLALHGKIIQAAENQDPAKTRLFLVKFKDLLVGHLLKENTSLYTYLRHSLGDDPSAELVMDMKYEMDSVARGITQFLKPAIEEGYSYDARFVEKFNEIGTALVRRVENEEDFLYPTYQQQG